MSRELEHKLQVQCVRYFRLKHPKELIFAIPNGGKRNLITAMKMKAEGVLAGIPDLMVAASRNGYHGLFIEMKNGKVGRVTEHQTEAMKRLEAEGYKCEVVRDFASFCQVTEDYLQTK